MAGPDVDPIEALFARGVTDGLPVVPPTAGRVMAAIAAVGRSPDEVIAEVPPRFGRATVQKVAVNAVMAGCRPEYLPVVVAAVEAMCDERFCLLGVSGTTDAVAPLVIVNGPIRAKLDINSGAGVFGPGWRANATIGRAVRLCWVNIGGAAPGVISMSTFGGPARYTYCIGENEEASPWEPLHVEHGFDRGTSVVTTIACEGPHNIQDHYSYTGLGILKVVAGAMGQAGSNNILAGGHPLLCLGPEHAATIAGDGYSKRQVKEFLVEHARFPLARLGDEYRAHLIQRGVKDAPDTMVPAVRSVDDVTVIVAGGAGKHSCWQPTFGDQTWPTRRPIVRRDGTPLRTLTELTRG
jgi:hypothetical protein